MRSEQESTRRVRALLEKHISSRVTVLVTNLKVTARFELAGREWLSQLDGLMQMLPDHVVAIAYGGEGEIWERVER